MVMFHEPRIFMMILIVSLIVLCQLGSCTGVGKCPKLEYMENFNLTKFTGHWYEIERSFYLMEIISSCVNLDLTETPRGQLEIEVKTKSRWSGSLIVSEGLATQTKKDPSIWTYKVSSKLPRILNRYLPGAGNYQVLNTDYSNYAIIYSCSNFGVVHTDLIWIWGRQKELNVSFRSSIYNMLAEKHLDSERLILPKNSNCTD